MKKFLNVFMTICIIAGMFTVVPLTSSAATKTWNVSATSSDNVIATLDNEGTLTISGTGNMKNYSKDIRYVTVSLPSGINRTLEIEVSTAPWGSGGVDAPNPNRESIKNVIIEDGVTRIGSYAFFKCTNLENVTISDSVAKIGTASFKKCEKITHISLGYYNNTFELCSEAFYDCTALTSICFSSNVNCSTNNAIPNSSKITVYYPSYADVSSLKTSYSNINLKEHDEYTDDVWSILKYSTQTEHGIIGATCSITGAHNATKQIPDLSNSDFWTSNTKEETCSHEGSVTYTCKYGDIVDVIPINPNKHIWTWEILVNPTNESMGMSERVCSENKEHSELKKLPNLTDNEFWTKGEYIAPTTTSEGSQEYISEYGTFTETIPKLTPTPTIEPTATPTASPSPSATPSTKPTAIPTISPSVNPSTEPSIEPSTTPTTTPTISPSIEPSATPTTSPDTEPTDTPNPTVLPSTKPTIPPDIDINTNCIKITATYSTDGILESVSVEEIKISEIILSQNTKTNKVFYWESLESMKPLEWLYN